MPPRLLFAAVLLAVCAPVTRPLTVEIACPLTINGDRISEGHETFAVELFDVSGRC